MMEIKRSALVGHTPEQMFDLVNDVEAYPKRFTWCTGADVTSRDEHALVARLDLRFAGMSHSFSTHNSMQRPGRIDMRLLGGALRSLDGSWHFRPLGEHGSKVELDLRFEFQHRLLGPAMQLGFRGIADRMVDDFCAEAARTYV